MEVLDDIKSYKVLKLVLQSCGDLFFTYLTNREIGKLDSAISDINLRKFYLKEAELFYLSNQIQSMYELKWVMMRGIILTKCHLDFAFKGNTMLQLLYSRLHLLINFLVGDEEMALYSAITAKYPNLTEISGTNINEAGLSALGRINGSALTSVEFDNVDATDYGIFMLCKGNPDLKRLLLYIASESTVTDEGVRSIAKYCPGLEQLAFSGWDDPLNLSLDSLCMLPRIKEIDLSRLTRSAVMNLIRSNGANLEVLKLWGGIYCVDIQVRPSPLLLCLSECCAKLRELVLDIYVYDTVENVGYTALFRGCQSLESLLLTSFTDITLLRVAEHYPHLRALELRAQGYTDVGIAAVTSQCPALKSLKLHLAIKLTDASIHSIAEHCKGLEELALYSPSAVTDGAMCMLFESCTSLTSVTLSAAAQITDESIDTLLKCNRRLKNVSLQHDDVANTTALALALLPALETLTIKSLSLTDFTVRLIAEHCK